MYIVDIADSGIGRALLAGEEVESASPGYCPRKNSLEEARRSAAPGDVISVCSLIGRYNGAGEPLFRIRFVEQIPACAVSR